MTLTKKLSNIFPTGFGGFILFTIFLVFCFFSLPPVAFDPSNKAFIFALGFLAVWRYLWGLTHFVRSLVYRGITFPKWRKICNTANNDLMPSHIYLLITSFRIESDITARVVRGAIEDAIACGTRCTIVASIVEMADEYLYRNIFDSYDVPSHVDLKIVRIPGTGKRDALAQGFRAISRDMPAQDAVVVVVDGDTILAEGTLRKCTPFFKLNPNLGALTTDEIPEIFGAQTFLDWYKMRFAQRHILMSSLALSKRVMTLTGRMSMYRAEIVAHPDFITHMTNDFLDHWRLGRFKFLTGDDKSSLYWVLKQGWQQIYVPDVQITAVETPPSPSFMKSSTQLMIRWFGNMLRTNMRILHLGIKKMPFFTWWSFLDQRISMWTSLTGPIIAIMLASQYGIEIFIYYLVWVMFTRWIQAVILLSARNEISWRYPFLLYYNQIYGSLIKTYVMFRLDKQRWTKQKTKLQRGFSYWQNLGMSMASISVHATAMILFIVGLGILSGTFEMPKFGLFLAML